MWWKVDINYRIENCVGVCRRLWMCIFMNINEWNYKNIHFPFKFVMGYHAWINFWFLGHFMSEGPIVCFVVFPYLMLTKIFFLKNNILLGSIIFFVDEVFFIKILITMKMFVNELFYSAFFTLIIFIRGNCVCLNFFTENSFLFIFLCHDFFSEKKFYF